MTKLGGIPRSAIERTNYVFANFRPSSYARHHDKRHRASSLQYQGSKMITKAKTIRVNSMFGNCSETGHVPTGRLRQLEKRARELTIESSTPCLSSGCRSAMWDS